MATKPVKPKKAPAKKVTKKKVAPTEKKVTVVTTMAPITIWDPFKTIPFGGVYDPRHGHLEPEDSLELTEIKGIWGRSSTVKLARYEKNMKTDYHFVEIWPSDDIGEKDKKDRLVKTISKMNRWALHDDDDDMEINKSRK